MHSKMYFRFWCPAKEEMIYNTEEGYHTEISSGGDITLKHVSGCQYKINITDDPVNNIFNVMKMDFINLFDNKEDPESLYEGDIFIRNSSGKTKWIVYFNDCTYYAIDTENLYPPMRLGEWLNNLYPDFSIIGNIYEDPEIHVEDGIKQAFI